MFLETAYSSQTKLIGEDPNVSEHGIGYSNLTPDPQGAPGAPGVKIQVSPNQKTSLAKVVRHDKGMITISSHCEKSELKVVNLSKHLRGFNSLVVNVYYCLVI